MNNGPERSDNSENAPIVKKRSLSNYLSNIQKRKRELEENNRKQESDNKQGGQSSDASRLPLGTESDQKDKLGVAPAQVDRSASNATNDADAKTREIKPISEVNLERPSGGTIESTDREEQKEDYGSIQVGKKSQIDVTHKLEEERTIPSNETLPPPAEKRQEPSKTTSTDVAKSSSEDQLPKQPAEKVKTEEHQLNAGTQNKNKLTKTKLVELLRNDDMKDSSELENDNDESELSEVESDAPTEPASPPRPRLGRLVRGDELRSSPSSKAPRLHSDISDESELSDLDNLNQIPLSSSILHADSPPEKLSHQSLKSSPGGIFKGSQVSPTRRGVFVGLKKQAKAKRSTVHRDAGGRTKLQIACDKGKFEVAKKLIQEGFNVDDQDNAGNSSLHEAALNGHYDIVKLLLESGADVNIQSFEPIKDTPLIDAAANGHLDVVKLLLKYNADPTIANGKGLTAIESIEEDSDLENEDLHIIEGLKRALKSGIERFVGAGERRVRSSSNNRHSDSERSSSNIRMEDEFYWTDISFKVGREKLLRASKEGRLPYVGAYLENGGRVDVKSFFEAVKYGHEDITSLFLAFGAQVNTTTREEQTPLMVALGRGHLGTVKLLLEAGADPRMQDKQGRSVLSYAKRSELGLKSKQEVELIRKALETRGEGDAGISTGEFWSDEENETKDHNPKLDTKTESNGKSAALNAPRKMSDIPQKVSATRKRSSTVQQEDNSRNFTDKEGLSTNATTEVPPEFSVPDYTGSVANKKAKLKGSCSPNAVDLEQEAPRSQNATPMSSATPKPAETAEEKELRLKAEEEYRQKRLLNKKRKEQELLAKLAHDEKMRAEERERQNAQELQRKNEEKERMAREEELQRASAELNRRRQIRKHYPLGLRLIDFRSGDDFESFLPLYYVVLNGQKHVLDLQMCVLLKDVTFLSHHQDGPRVSHTHKTQIWNIYKFIFLRGGRHPTGLARQVQLEIDELPFKSRADLDSQELDFFVALPLRWVPWNEIEIPRDHALSVRFTNLEEQMIEISLFVDTNATQTPPPPPPPATIPARSQDPHVHRSNSTSTFSTSLTTKSCFLRFDSGIPVKLRSRPAITSLLKGNLPSW
ncbi:LAFA_0E02410g1_1 [Lachancea sp. 'fantastica']|nr:LAFA_0E02410g1_1 [Lachancea sp. 'fantastica']